MHVGTSGENEQHNPALYPSATSMVGTNVYQGYQG